MRILEILKVGLFKELVELISDKRSILFVLVVPVVALPAMILFLGQMTQSGLESISNQETQVCLLNPQYLPFELNDVLLAEEDDGDTAIKFLPGKNQRLAMVILMEGGGMLPIVKSRYFNEAYLKEWSDSFFENYQFIALDGLKGWDTALDLYSENYLNDAFASNTVPENLRSLKDKTGQVVKENGCDVLMHFSGDPEAGSGKTRLLYDANQESAQFAVSKTSQLAASINLIASKESLVDYQPALNYEAHKINYGGYFNIRARIIAYTVVFMCFIGGLYFGVDALAGEKERATLKNLLLLPYPLLSITLPKAIVTTMAHFVAGFLGALGIMLLSESGYASWLSNQGFLGWNIFSASLTILASVSVLFTGIILALSVVANNYKQALMYALPVNFMVLACAIPVFVPGFEQTSDTVWVPVMNAVLGIRDIWEHNMSAWNFLRVVIVNAGVGIMLLGYVHYRLLVREQNRR